MKTSDAALKEERLYAFPLSRPAVVYTHLDGWYYLDITGYIEFLTSFRGGIKKLLELLIFSQEEQTVPVQQFLLSHTADLKILELTRIIDLLRALMATENIIRSEELKSELYYQLFHIIESVNNKIYEKKSVLYTSHKNE